MARRTTKSRVTQAAPEKTESKAQAPRSYDGVISRLNGLAEQYGSVLGADRIFDIFSRAGYGMSNQPQIQNARIKGINPLPADYSKEDLGFFLTSPQTSEIPLRQISQVLRWSAYPYFKVTKSYADMLSYRHYVKPLYVDGTTARAEDFKREWKLVDKVEKAFHTEEFGHQAAGQAVTNGKVFYILRSSVDKVHNKVNYLFPQQLPQDWCIPIGFNNISKYTISFDMMYFMQPGTDYAQYGDLFEPFIRDFWEMFQPPKDRNGIPKAVYASQQVTVGGKKYPLYLDNLKENAAGQPEMFQQNGRWCYYVSLPIDRVWTFEIDDTTAIVASPLSGLLQTFAQQADYEAAQLSLIMNPLIKIFTGEIPYDTGDAAKPEDSYKLSLGGRAMFEAFWNQMMAATNTGGTAFFMAPVENVKSHDFPDAAGANDVSSSFLEYGMGKTGLQALIPTVSNPHAGVEEYSAKLESRFADRVYRTLERMFNHFLTTLNLKYDWEMRVFGSVYNDELIRANALKQLDKGDITQQAILAALDNMSLLDRLSMSHAIKESGLLELMIPPATAYTQSGKVDSSADHNSGSSATGAPTKTEAERKETVVEKEISTGEGSE